MNEIWKDIKGYKGLYQASSLGRFKNLRNGKFLSPTFCDDRNGGVLGLRNRNGICRSVIPSRIIAELFVPNPNKYGIVNCKGNKKNLHYSNLYWISYSELIKKPRTRMVRKFICRTCKKNFKTISNKTERIYCSKKCQFISYRKKDHMSRKSRRKMIESKLKKVIAIKRRKRIKFNSIDEAALHFRLTPCTISNVLAGRGNTAAGHKFRFL